MKRLLLVSALVLAVTAAAVAIIARQDAGIASQPEPYTAVVYENGETVSVASLRGKPALLSSWATWCAECQHELPSLEQLWERREGDGLQIVAVNIDVDTENPGIPQMISDLGMTMPVWSDPDNTYSDVFNAPGVPVSVLLDARGQVVKTWIGRTDFQAEDVSAAIDSALAQR
jgi:thiol-disulfide isomerase/thioredoxin